MITVTCTRRKLKCMHIQWRIYIVNSSCDNFFHEKCKKKFVFCFSPSFSSIHTHKLQVSTLSSLHSIKEEKKRHNTRTGQNQAMPLDSKQRTTL